MKRIYTRTGDAGTTGIHGGERVAKDDVRIEANGALDELNCHIGIIRSMLPEQSGQGISFDAPLQECQQILMALMSLVATPSAKRAQNPNSLPDNLIPDIESQIDRFTAEAGESVHFILPGGTPLAARMQLARAVCRRAERRLWTLHRQDPLPEEILRYINRLSDLLFVMARCELARQNWPEERWKAFTYKRAAK
ncbi:MAG: cob(I)yrinic acid a,c-diamide adenosyltransferase [Bacteroidales bacterium]|nr:cob(I)yrinic acid a,c-diamide adenosyltransferase [Bacteroidales bacterium]